MTRARKFVIGVVILGGVACLVSFLGWYGQKVAYDAAMRKEFDLAASIWKPLAFIGYSGPQHNLALSYSKGRGVAADQEKAVYWYTKAANNGDVAAQYNLAEHFRTGEGVAINYHEAMKWFRTAANQNYQSAQNNLGMMLAEGKGTQPDLIEACKWFEIAIGNGSESARENLILYKKELSEKQISEVNRRMADWYESRRYKSNSQLHADAIQRR